MPKGPRGETRPADVVGAAVMIGRIATGDLQDNIKSNRVKSGRAGARARSKNLSSERRKEIAQTAAKARWK